MEVPGLTNLDSTRSHRHLPLVCKYASVQAGNVRRAVSSASKLALQSDCCVTVVNEPRTLPAAIEEIYPINGQRMDSIPLSE